MKVHEFFSSEDKWNKFVAWANLEGRPIYKTDLPPGTESVHPSQLGSCCLLGAVAACYGGLPYLRYSAEGAAVLKSLAEAINPRVYSDDVPTSELEHIVYRFNDSSTYKKVKDLALKLDV